MFWSLETLRGYTIRAQDDSLGKVIDFLFDDAHWTVRYLVVDTGWLFGRKVLIATAVAGRPDRASRAVPVSVTRKQVEDSPGVDADRPVNRQQESELHAYYGWTPWWGAGLASVAAGPHGPTRAGEHLPRDDPHLRSEREVSRYHIHATDGSIGHVDDFLLDEDDWRIRYLVVDTGNWLPGRKVLLAPDWIRRIDWGQRELEVNHTRQQIKDSPAYDPNTTVDRGYERRLFGHYRQTIYWGE